MAIRLMRPTTGRRGSGNVWSSSRRLITILRQKNVRGRLFREKQIVPCMLDWNEGGGWVRRSPLWPHVRGSVPRRCRRPRALALAARAAAPAGHGSTNVGPTVVSYGPLTHLQSSINGPQIEPSASEA